MRSLIILFFLFLSFQLHADTMDHYMNIANNIPQMEMKADPQSQAWARSARNVLIIAHETIAETLMQANELAQKQGNPFFCLPPGTNLDAATLGPIIVATYNEISSQQSNKDQMTVSQVAWLGVTKNYPCNNQSSAAAKEMQHMSALLTH